MNKILNHIQSRKVIAATILSVGIVIAACSLGNAIIKFKYHERTLAVKGLAERLVSSDQAIWNIRLSYGSDSLTELYSGILSTQEKIKKFLQSKNFVLEEIELQPASVTDNSSNAYVNPNDKVKKYVSDFGVVVTTKKIDQIKQSAQQTIELIEAGVVITSSYINYGYTKLNDIKSDILDEATANAKKTAESFAAKSNNKLGKIKSASQGQITINDAGVDNESNLSINKSVRIVTSITYFLE